MNPVFRGAVIYIFLLILFRIMGKRSLNETTTFDFVLLLIISEVTQQALVGEDFSLTASALLITTLMGIDMILTITKQKFAMFGRIVEGAPLVIVDNGKPLKKRMQKTQVDEEDILHAARSNFGIEKMEEIKYAVLEKDGTISIIPVQNSSS
ncbi:DUF421 domain-containing protein [Flavisolibacter ginsengisoli]|jgi:uncharacterized membrane protein YcaP (DUF421 family)|uniref:YetF C-terminal domain-containing protein n=1 Tax=Flavisolibacter ginsengisoli DSM 18119 TaxID=1121884 RepID=A0A1M5G644_9BACT|nr:YetF domain-containing protein [Flavisolibacter ginsengisoli]SHF99203.1 Protein of unknown function [Flavisolibacter ginsengisoli DSM 18119]